MFNKINKAFTLAEVLLTLTIIGVVAALTIPNLKETSDKAANLSLLQKAYSTASNAFAQLQAENGSPIYWTSSGVRVFKDESSEGISKFLKQKMNVASDKDIIPKDYKIKLLSGSAFSSSTKIDDTVIDISSKDAFQTVDGMLWFPSKTYSGCKYTKEGQQYENAARAAQNTNWSNFLFAPAYAVDRYNWGQQQQQDLNITVNLCGLLMVDTNGTKKPNRMGIDVFIFDITTDGIKPHGGTDDCASITGNGFTCSLKALSGVEKALDFIYD